MIAALAFLRSPIGKWLAVGAVLGLVLLAWRIDHGMQAGRLKRCAGALTAAREGLSLARANEATLDAAVKAQSAAVDKLASDGRAREQQAQAAVLEALKGRESAERRAARIMAAKPKGDGCAAADRLILESLR